MVSEVRPLSPESRIPVTDLTCNLPLSLPACTRLALARHPFSDRRANGNTYEQLVDPDPSRRPRHAPIMLWQEWRARVRFQRERKAALCETYIVPDKAAAGAQVMR